MHSTSLPPPIWVDTPAALQRMVRTLQAQPRLAVDTESNSLYAYTEQVCLIQFSTPSADYLVDPLALADLSPLAPLFANPHIEKIFHAAEYDLICLRRDFNFTFANIFDTMLAARILGKSAVGLGSLLEEYFQIKLDKRFQRANWGQRPLSSAMLAYARLDTHYLFELRDRFYTELVEAERWLIAVEDFQRMCSAGLNGKSNGIEACCWKVSGAQDLDPRQAAVLQALWQFRDTQARRVDVPPFKIMGDSTLIDLARACPQTPEDLQSATHLSPKQFQRYASGLLESIASGLQAPPLERPAPPRRDYRLIERVDALKQWRKHKAQQLGVESDVILPRDMLQAIAEANPSNWLALSELLNPLPYRLQHFGEEIIKTLKQ